MMSDSVLLLLADGVLLLHFGVVLFVVVGLGVILAGNLLGWAWVNGFWFRIGHLATIVLVAVSAWLGIPCPLTTLEAWLRTQAGLETYRESFIEHWVQRVIFYEAPFWVFTSVYTVFGLVVVVVWWRFPPEPPATR